MEELISLWLPILVSTAATFFASFIAWTMLPHHKKDWNGLPNEEAFLDAMRSSGATPGQYMFPYCGDWKEMKNPEVKARYERGPHGTLNLWPGVPNMGANMVKSIAFILIANIFLAYVATTALAPGAAYLDVFQIVGTVGIMMYCFGSILNDIWFNTPVRAGVMNFIDGVVYALITAGIFGAMWPGA